MFADDFPNYFRFRFLNRCCSVRIESKSAILISDYSH